MKYSLRILFLCIYIVCALSVTACDMDSAQADKPGILDNFTPKNPIDTMEKVEEVPINPLTGLIIDRTDYGMRPYAVMINNASKALPQSGISQADIFCEALAEGGVTRILAVFQEYNVEKIGPIRSARHYFIDFAYDYDALFVHHGRSPMADEAIKSLGVENLDGMELEGTAFWRDEERLKISGMYEHSSYTSSQGLLEAARSKGYRIDKREFNYPFDFYDEDTSAGQSHDDIIRVQFSDYQKVAFIYNDETKLYERWQNGEPQIDELTGEPVRVKNVLFQYAKVYELPDDTEGRRNVETISSGSGALFSNGTMHPVKWSKSDSKTPVVWTDLNGSKLKLNKGKTWICVIGDDS